MAVVIVPNACRGLTGSERVTQAAVNVAGLLRALDARYPGFAEALGPRFAVSIDGVIHGNADYERIEDDAEVAFLPPIAGG
ncbi:MAG: MoaD/ThiS family protein [Deltaproteobacteria bacterium]|nr:MoaD/ThiS family protein [Deltaproteobacteria bacterium]